MSLCHAASEIFRSQLLVNAESAEQSETEQCLAATLSTYKGTERHCACIAYDRVRYCLSGTATAACRRGGTC